MAPEVERKKGAYRGIMNDIFAMGVILFIFMTGTPPFKSADPKDPLYNLIVTNRHEKFWRFHEERKD